MLVARSRWHTRQMTALTLMLAIRARPDLEMNRHEGLRQQAATCSRCRLASEFHARAQISEIA